MKINREIYLVIYNETQGYHYESLEKFESQLAKGWEVKEKHLLENDAAVRACELTRELRSNNCNSFGNGY